MPRTFRVPREGAGGVCWAQHRRGCRGTSLRRSRPWPAPGEVKVRSVIGGVSTGRLWLWLARLHGVETPHLLLQAGAGSQRCPWAGLPRRPADGEDARRAYMSTHATNVASGSFDEPAS